MSHKKAYRIRNWKEHNESLVQRGSVILWLDETTLAHWQGKQEPGRRGRPQLVV